MIQFRKLSDGDVRFFAGQIMAATTAKMGPDFSKSLMGQEHAEKLARVIEGMISYCMCFNDELPKSAEN